MKWNKITSGLFLYRGLYFWRNIKDVFILIGRFFFILKHGYNPIARWDYYAWFIDTTKDILTEYLKDHVGYKIIDDTKSPEWNQQVWENIIKEMINCLDKMKEENYLEDKPKKPDMSMTTEEVKRRNKEIDNWYNNTYKEIHKAKRRFFLLMNKYFYDLWD